MSEKHVKEQVKKILKAHMPRVAYYMPVQTGYGRHGIEDFCVCAYSIWLAIETKDTAKSKHSEHQKIRRDEIVAAGGLYVIIHQDNLDWLEQLLNAMQKRFEEARMRKTNVRQ